MTDTSNIDERGFGRGGQDVPEGEMRGGRRRRGGPGGRGRGGHGLPGRRRRGAVRAAILSQLAVAPSNGYGLIRSISAGTDGAWTPSPGSIYPTLQQLVDEGLVEPTSSDPRADFQLTTQGRAHVAEQAEGLDRAWRVAFEDSAGLADLRAAATALMGAVDQVRLSGTPDQVASASAELQRVRRALFALLAEEPTADAGSSGVGQ